MGFPPFCRLARWIISHSRDEHARLEAQSLARRIRERLPDAAQVDLLGPNPAPIPRLRGQYRHDLLLRTSTGLQLQDTLESLRNSGILRVRSASLTLDVDPVSLA
jgi:primosomal protein N' (replication factor Y)